MQGGLTYESGKTGVLLAVSEILKHREKEMQTGERLTEAGIEQAFAPYTAL